MHYSFDISNSREPDIYKAIFDYAKKILLFNFPSEQIILLKKNQIIYRCNIKKRFYNSLEKHYSDFKNIWLAEYKRAPLKLEKKLECLIDSCLKDAYFTEIISKHKIQGVAFKER